MTPERWQQIQTLLGAALERPVSERAGYVAGVCAGDADLAREVNSLLAQASEGSGFLSTPAMAMGATATTTVAAATLIGKTISGRYHVRSRLGAGGMGDVYLADDAQLRCAVALKAVRETEPTPEGRARLLREARAAAALRDHANIAAIYDVLDSVDGETPPLIVMEYVEGETLSDRLRGNPLPQAEAVRFARDIADALAAAHRRGIMHRDLKPANLRITRDNRIKVLDFGLARRIATPAATDTSTMAGDHADSLMLRVAGTPGYMSPEQLLGRPIGAPSDVFSLGVVLFEMISGRRPVAGNDFFSAAQAILARPIPRLADAVPGVSPAIDGLVARMLSVEAAHRPTAAEVAAELDGLAPPSQRDAASPSMRTAPRRVTLLAALVIIAIALAAGIAWWRVSRNPSARPPTIAVLPLVNVGGDASKDYLGVGIADTLTTSLARVSTVSVVSRTGLADASKGADVATIARDLGATLVLQGSVQTSGDLIRVNAKLLRPDGSVAWAGQLDSMTSDVFALETRLAASVISGLPVRVSQSEQQAAVTPPTTNPDALEAYWQGLAFLDRNDPAGIGRAIEDFERATSIDPQFATAFAALAEAYRAEYTKSHEPGSIAKAMAAVTRAVQLDPARVDVKLYLGALYADTGRQREAEDQFRAIIAQHPDNDDAHRRLAGVLNDAGRPNDALREYEAAVMLRPDFWRNQQQLGYFYYTQKRLREAVDAFTRVIALRPQDPTAFVQRGAALLAMDDRARAAEDYERSLDLDSSNAPAYSNLGIIYYADRRYENAIKAFESAIKLRPKQPIYHRNLGDAYLKLHRTSDAQREYLAAAALTQEALVINPADANNLSRLAVYEAKLGRASDARRHSDEAVARNATSPDVLFRRGVALALVGETKDAVSALASAIAHGYNVEQIRKEDDLAGLANVPEFRKLVSSRP